MSEHDEVDDPPYFPVARPRRTRTPEEAATLLAEVAERAHARFAEADRVRAAYLATPEGQESERRKLEAAERARVRALEVRANQAGCADGRDVRIAAFAADASGPVIDSVLEVIEWARGEGGDGYGRQPAVRALLADRGVGKTVALVYALTRTHRTGHYVTAGDVTRTHRAMHDNRFAWAQWTRCDLLALDEVGIEEKPEVISELLLDRWTAGGITLLAGNLARKTFVDRYLSGELGPRLRDRLGAQHAAGIAPITEFAGTSRRAKPAKL